MDTHWLWGHDSTQHREMVSEACVVANFIACRELIIQVLSCCWKWLYMGQELSGCSGTEEVLTGESGGNLLSKSGGQVWYWHKEIFKAWEGVWQKQPLPFFTSGSDLNCSSKEGDWVKQLVEAMSPCQSTMPRQKGMENQQQPLCN